MRARALLCLLPVLAACETSPITSNLRPDAAARAEAPFSYGAPVTAEGHLTGADGVQLFYRVVGTGPDTAVVLHGGPGLSMGYLAADLAPLAHGRTLVFYDQRGNGRSSLIADPAGLTVDRFVADLDAVRAHFGLEKMALVAHSWGGLLAGRYAAANPGRVERLVLLNPVPPSAALFGEFEANLAVRTAPDTASARRQNELVMLWFTGAATPESCAEYLGLRFANYMYDPAALAGMRGAWCDVPPAAAAVVLPTYLAVMGSLPAGWDLTPALAGLDVPTLVVHGAGDVIPLTGSRAWAAAIPGARLEVMDEAGHFPWLERPVPFFTTVNTFLRREGL